LSNGVSGAGMLPVFAEYAKLGMGYALMAEQVHTRHMVHAYLFAGPKGVGKATFARYLAAALFCDSENKPCGTCAACQRVFTSNEPDVTEILSPDDKVIPIDRIREAIATIAQHSFGNGPRVVIIEPFEKLTPAAQNCLLKSLEEPPADVLFFLLSHEASSLLGTIASRCSIIKLTPWPDEIIRQAMRKMGFEANRIEATLPRASGNIGQAIAALQNTGSESELQSLIGQALSARGDADVVTLSTKLKDDRDGAERALTSLEQSIHQALLAKTGILPNASVEDPHIREWIDHASITDLSELLQTVFDTRKWRQSQVNWQASIDRLLMKIVEAKTKW